MGVIGVASGPHAEAPIDRPRLLARLEGARTAVIEAGAGYGKSTLASQYRRHLGEATAYVPLGPPDADPGVLVGSLRRALAAARLSDLLALTEGAADPREWVERLLDALSASGDPLLVVIDDAHHITTPATAALVVRLARSLPQPHGLLVAARGLVGALEELRTLPATVRLDTAELAFTLGETERLLDAGSAQTGPDAARVIHEATHGWATAVVLATRAPAPEVAETHDLVGAPLRTILAAMDAEDRSLATTLAHLPVISHELADLIAPSTGGLQRLITAGIPVTRADSGWWEMPSPVAAVLAGLAPIAAAAVQAAVDVYERHGADLLALRTRYADDADAAASWLAQMDVVRVERLGLGVVEDLVASLPAASIDRHPRVLLHLARLAEPAHRGDVRSRALARAQAAQATASDVEVGDELDAERARDLMWDTRTRAQSRELAEMVSARGTGEIARARVLDTLGRLDCWFSETGPRPQARQALLEAARLARGLGQRTWTAQALVALASGYHFARCEYGHALSVLEDALGELPSRNRYRAMVHVFRAETLIELGRFTDADAVLQEVREIGAACREHWVIAFAAWQGAELASYRGDRHATVDAYHEALRERDEWYEQPSGLEFEVQAADYLSRVGEHARALEVLGRARERRAASAHLVAVHEAAVLARSGDPGEAWSAIDGALADPATEPQERWPLLVLRAHVAGRRGDPQAGALAARAFELARELGHPEGPLIRERELAEPLLTLAAESGGDAAGELTRRRRHDTWEIRLLGGWELTRRGEPIELPAGRPALAVRIVAAAGGRMHAEQLIEHLWPETAPAPGRNRLRNLLSRVRAVAGDLLVRDGPAVVLSPGATVDLAELLRAADAVHRALAGGDPRRGVTLARSALERVRGQLLPDDVYAEWALEPRRQARGAELELVEVLAASAERDGEVDEAARLLRRAIALDPDEPGRYDALAALLRSQGRRSAADAVLGDRGGESD